MFREEEESLGRGHQSTEARPTATVQPDKAQLGERLSQSFGQHSVVMIGRIDIDNHSAFRTAICVRFNPRQAVRTDNNERHAKQFLAGNHTANVASDSIERHSDQGMW
jgi:hypothetical protein